MLFLRLAPIVFVIVIHWSRSTVPAMFERFENCSSSGKSLKIHRCEVSKDHKVYFDGTLIKPIDNFIVEASVMRKVGNNYRPTFPISKINWCQMISSQVVNKSPVISIIKKIVRPFIPMMFEKCPFSGNVSLPGILLPASVSSILPVGSYRLNFCGHNSDDSHVFAASLIIVKSK